MDQECKKTSYVIVYCAVNSAVIEMSCFIGHRKWPTLRVIIGAED